MYSIIELIIYPLVDTLLIWQCKSLPNTTELYELFIHEIGMMYFDIDPAVN